MEDGEMYGIEGTPTIFINGVKLTNLSAMAFHAAIDAHSRRARAHAISGFCAERLPPYRWRVPLWLWNLSVR